MHGWQLDEGNRQMVILADADADDVVTNYLLDEANYRFV
jgi:hypothetical protein